MIILSATFALLQSDYEARAAAAEEAIAVERLRATEVLEGIQAWRFAPNQYRVARRVPGGEGGSGGGGPAEGDGKGLCSGGGSGNAVGLALRDSLRPGCRVPARLGTKPGLVPAVLKDLVDHAASFADPLVRGQVGLQLSALPLDVHPPARFDGGRPELHQFLAQNAAALEVRFGPPVMLHRIIQERRGPGARQEVLQAERLPS